MKNRDLEKQKDSSKRDLDDFALNANNIIDELVSEIETLEDQLSDKEAEVEKLESELEDLRNELLEERE